MKHDDGLRLVLVEGAAALRRKAAPVPSAKDGEPWPGPEAVATIRALATTCKAAGGLGLAATQIGVPLRIVVIDGGDLALINPVIVDAATTRWAAYEACLSQPGVKAVVSRSTRVVVRSDPWDGEDDIMQGERGRVVQHEIDHLDGVLITDRGGRIGPVGWASPYGDVTPERLKGTDRRPVFCPGCGHAYDWDWTFAVVQARCFSAPCVKQTKGDGTLITVKGRRPWR